jgi:hypothetical protein
MLQITKPKALLASQQYQPLFWCTVKHSMFKPLCRPANVALLLALLMSSGLCAAQHAESQTAPSSGSRNAKSLELEAQQRRAGLRAALKTETAKETEERDAVAGHQLSPQQRAELRQQIRLQPPGGLTK